MPLMMEANFRFREIGDPGTLKVSTADTLLLSICPVSLICPVDRNYSLFTWVKSVSIADIRRVHEGLKVSQTLTQ